MQKLKTISFCIPVLLLFIASNCDDDTPISTEATPLSLNTPPFFGTPDIPEDNPLTVEGVALGRELFYERKLSLDSSISCGSCHIQEFAFSDTATFSLGVNNARTTRQSMSLSNLPFQDDFFWDARTQTLEEQVFGPLEASLEMNLDRDIAVQRLQNTLKYPLLFEKAFVTSVITPTL